MSTNGPTAMYTMKPLFNLDNVHLQDDSGMYKIKTLQSPTKASGDGKETVEEIEKRQECLLQKIAELKAILVSIRSLSKVPNPKIACKMAVATPDFSKLGLAHDIVLNVNPNYPLYSFLGLAKIWDWFRNVNYTWHTHSSLRSLPESAKSFQDKISSTQEPVLNITFVWKNVPDCEFVLSPIKSVPIVGEVNFLRFLNRLVSPEQDILGQSLQDGKMDACHALQTSSDKEALEHFELLSDCLDKDWLMGGNISILDIAAWSAIKKMKKPNLKPKLASWYNRCDQFVISS